MGSRPGKPIVKCLEYNALLADTIISVRHNTWRKEWFVRQLFVAVAQIFLSVVFPITPVEVKQRRRLCFGSVDFFVSWITKKIINDFSRNFAEGSCAYRRALNRAGKLRFWKKLSFRF